MENQKIISQDLNNFLINKEREILAIAQKNTEEIVKREMALSDFELLLSANFSEEEREELTNKSRILRKENWEELSKKFNGNFKKIMDFIDIA